MAVPQFSVTEGKEQHVVRKGHGRSTQEGLLQG